MMLDTKLIYFIFYCGCAVSGQLFFEFFFSFMILMYAVRISTLANVIKAITLNATQLVMTLLLIVILLYIYSIIGFFFITDMFYDWLINKWDDDIPGEDICQDMR